MAVVYPYEGRERDLSTILANSGIYVLRLFQNDISPDVDTVLTDFDDADFSGYASVTLTLSAIFRNGDDNAETVALLAQFAHNGGGTANDIYGWYLTNMAGGIEALVYCERFGDAPRVMDTLGDIINVTPSIAQGDCP